MSNTPPASQLAPPSAPANTPEGLLHGYKVSSIQSKKLPNGAFVYEINIDPALSPENLSKLNAKLQEVSLQNNGSGTYTIVGDIRRSNLHATLTSEQKQPPQAVQQQPQSQPQLPQGQPQQQPQNQPQQSQVPQTTQQAASPSQVVQNTGSRAASVLNAAPSNFHSVALDHITDKSLKGSVRTYNAIRALGVGVPELRLLTRLLDPRTVAMHLFIKKLSELRTVLSSNNRQLEPSEVAMLTAIQKRINKLNTDPDHWTKLIKHLTDNGVLT